MKLYAVRVFVENWESAYHFYEKVLKLPLSFKDDGFGWAEFDIGGPKLGLERVSSGDEEGKKLVGRFLGVSLQVEDIQSTYEDLKRLGVEFAGPPQKQSWGGTLAHFKDPAGNTLTLLGSDF